MQCPACGEKNPDEAHFCGKCGAQIASAFSGTKGPVESLGGYEDESGDLPTVEPEVSESIPDYTKPAFTETPPSPPLSATDKPEGQSQQQNQESSAPSTSPPPTGFVPAPPDPNAPGAGLTKQSAPPIQPPPHPDTSQMTGQDYYRQGMGNTSGMGDGYPTPPEAEGWTFAGFIPWGLFSFVNGNILWGILYWVLSVFGFTIIYMIVVGISGKKHAWQGRRFESITQYQQTMQAWNTWGIISLVVGIVVTVIVSVIYFALILAVVADESFIPT